MKKIVVLLAFVASFAFAQAQHIEFKWRGPYVVADYSYAMTFLHPEFSTSFSGFTGEVGFQFRRAAAAGVNVSYLTDASGCFTQVPVMLAFRSHLMTSRLTPYLMCGVGYTFPTGSRVSNAFEVLSGADTVRSFSVENGGVTAAVAVGGRYAFTRKFGISFEVAYQLLSMRQVNRYDQKDMLCGLEPELFHLAKFSVGFNF